MRLLTIIIILALSVTLLSSPGVMRWSPDETGTTVIMELDVCHKSSGSGIAFDLTYLLICPCPQLSYGVVGIEPVLDTPVRETLLAFRDEHPPKRLLS